MDNTSDQHHDSEKKVPTGLEDNQTVSILKPQKTKMNKTGYTLLANMCILGKVIEEYVKKELTENLENNEIPLSKHHTGQKGHSAVTTRTITNQECAEVIERNQLTVVLSATFNTVNVDILINKMDFYGIAEATRKIVEIYLTGRTQITK